MFFLDLQDAISAQLMSKIIGDLIKDHKANRLPRLEKLQRYYKGEHDVLKRAMDDTTKPNNKLVNDYPGYIIDTVQGYFIGKPVRYGSRSDNKDYLKALGDIFDACNEPDHNAEIAKTMGISGEAHELLYVNENSEIRFVQIPNEEMIVVFEPDFQKSIQLALRYYTLKDGITGKETLKVVLYWADRIEYYIQSGSSYVLEETEPHYFGRVPVVYYHNNDERLGDFEKVISLVNDYNVRLSDNSNELESFRNAYLKIKGMSGTTSEDVERSKVAGAFLVDAGGDVSFIEKNVNDAVTEHHMERLDANIHKFSKVPNLADESFAGNLSGVAIKYKLWPIEQIASNKERKFITGLKRRIRLITEILNTKGASYDWKDIDVTMARNMPANLLEAAQMAAQLKGIVSDETLLGQLPFVESPGEELERMQKEAEAGADYAPIVP